MEALLPLAVLLACPVGMGLMMWFMGRNQRRTERPAPEPGGLAPQTSVAEATSLAELKARHASLAAEIDRLEGEDGATRERIADA